MDAKTAELIELEKQGLAALNQDRFQEAAECFRKILVIRPDWEEGQGFYDLACALEDTSDLQEARQAYERAISYRPNEVIFWGGYASFLYLHGDPEEALAAYLRVYGIEERLGQTEQMKKTRIGISALGERLGLSETEIEERIKRST